MIDAATDYVHRENRYGLVITFMHITWTQRLEKICLKAWQLCIMCMIESDLDLQSGLIVSRRGDVSQTAPETSSS